MFNAYSNAVRFAFEPEAFAREHGFVPPASWPRRSEWERRELCARFLEDHGVDVNDTRKP